VSTANNANGAAASIAYQYIARRFSGGANLQWMSRRYTNLTLAPTNDRPLLQAQASTSVDLGFGSTLGLQYLYER
jgi:hypothetical protein